MAEYLRKECGDLNEVALDNDYAKNDDDDDANIKGVEVVEIGAGEALTILHKLANLKYLLKKETLLFQGKTNYRRWECWKKAKL